MRVFSTLVVTNLGRERLITLPQIQSITGTQGHLFEPTDAERDARTGDEWILSTIDYLQWRAGRSWRKITRASQRWAEERWYYLHAARLLNELRYSPDEPRGAAPTHEEPKPVQGFVSAPPKKPVRSARIENIQKILSRGKRA